MKKKGAVQKAQELLATCANLDLYLLDKAITAIQSHKGRGYREVRIPKKSGGVRIIHAPCDELKIVQASLLPFLYRFSTDKRMFGFMPGRSPVDNARFHLELPDHDDPKKEKIFARVVPRWTLTIDIKDFFPSVTAELLEKIYWNLFPYYDLFSCDDMVDYDELQERENWEIHDELIRLLLILTTHQGRLPQGAPTSPYLANLALCFTGMLERIEAVCEARKTREDFRFSIYADDITISSRKDKISDRLVAMFIQAIEQDGYFTVNPKKTRRNSAKYKAHKITGVVITRGTWVYHKNEGIYISRDSAKLTLPQKTLKNYRGRIHRMRWQLENQAELDFVELDQVIGCIAWIKEVYQGGPMPASVRSEVASFDKALASYQEWKKSEERRKWRAFLTFLFQLERSQIQRQQAERG